MRARLREVVRFPDLSERRALKLVAVSHYTARAHFGLWHRRMGGPDFTQQSAVFTPLYFVDIETTDVPLDPQSALRVRGETCLARSVDDAGGTTRLLREGRHTVVVHNDGAEVMVARAQLLNVFTRYDPDPARRRVTVLPPHWGLGDAPSRTRELPRHDTLLPLDRPPDFAERELRVWHYGQTDPNRHVSGMEYLRMMECYVAEEIGRRGHDLKQLYFSRARIVYRKPCFRGETYRRVAWIRSEIPLVVAGAFFKGDDAPEARPAVAIELTLAEHGTSTESA